MNISHRNDEKLPGKVGFQKKSEFKITDSNKIGVIFVLRGSCRIFWEVRKFRDRSQTVDMPASKGTTSDDYSEDED
jgi:hypothetical protein